MSLPNFTGPSYIPDTLPPGAADHLRLDHPRLIELRKRYAAFQPFEHPLWTPDMLKHYLEFPYFRGDNVYTWQVRGGVQESQYVLTAYYAQSIDQLGLFQKLTEDSLFGVYAYDFNGRQTITRDFLDSILQINFLERHIGISRIAGLKMLDLGAGYGRLGWRLTQALPNLETVWCTDAIAESTFLCEYYLAFREAGPKAIVVPLDKAEAVLKNQGIDAVTNIQSFSECTLASVEWWLRILSTARVSYLMIMPSTPDRLLTMESNGTRLDFAPMLERAGYRLIVRESCYEGAASVQKFGVYGSGQYWLFGR